MLITWVLTSWEQRLTNQRYGLIDCFCSKTHLVVGTSQWLLQAMDRGMLSRPLFERLFARSFQLHRLCVLIGTTRMSSSQCLCQNISLLSTSRLLWSNPLCHTFMFRTCLSHEGPDPQGMMTTISTSDSISKAL